MSIQYFTLHNFRFEDGTTLPQVRLAYREFNPSQSKTALVPTCFRGRIDDTPSFADGALRDCRVVVVALLGNGESSSPSNTPGFPRTLDYRDCVRAQHALVTQHLGADRLHAVVGFSMAGQCAYHWAAMYPQLVANAVVICSSARTSLHNIQFLEGPRAALENAADYVDGRFRAEGAAPPLRGLHAFGRAYSAWLASAEWFEERLFEKLGFRTLEDWTVGFIDSGYDDWYPDDLLVMLAMWQRSDVGVHGGNLPLAEALGQLSATRFLVMPSKTDQYFRWEVSAKEVEYLEHAELAVIPSVWGHLAGGGCSPEDNKWMDERIARFLGSS